MKLMSHEPRSRTPRHLMPLALRVPEGMLHEIDSIAATRPDQPDRSSLVRQLLAQALAANREKSTAGAAVTG